MSPSRKVNSLVGQATRYIAGRNAMQTVYWRTSPGPNGRMMKYNKTFEFGKANEMPESMRFHNYHDRNFKTTHE